MLREIEKLEQLKSQHSLSDMATEVDRSRVGLSSKAILADADLDKDLRKKNILSRSNNVLPGSD